MAAILLVDDDELTLQMLQATLQEEHQVDILDQGELAVQRAAEHEYELIVLDVDMPGLDGYATCAAIKRGGASAAAPVLFLSARTALDERLRGYAVGGDDYLSKPFDAEELQAKVRRALEQRRREKALGRSPSGVALAALCDALAAELEAQAREWGLEETQRLRLQRLVQAHRGALLGTLLLRDGPQD